MDARLYWTLPLFFVGLDAEVGIRLLPVLGQNHVMWVSGFASWGESCVHPSVQGPHKIQPA